MQPLQRPLAGTAQIDDRGPVPVAVIAIGQHAGETVFVVRDLFGLVDTVSEQRVRILDETLTVIANRSSEILAEANSGRSTDSAAGGARTGSQTAIEREQLVAVSPSVDPGAVPPASGSADRRCAFCPHVGSDHTERYDSSWCRTCNAGEEMAGPCSSYFMPVHEFVPSSPDRRGPHGTVRADDCRTCGLGADNDAHLTAVPA